jgi:hypothetical protein
MRKLKDEFLGKGGGADAESANAVESPKKAPSRKRKTDGGGKAAASKKTKKSAARDEENDEAAGMSLGSGDGGILVEKKNENVNEESEC